MFNFDTFMAKCQRFASKNLVKFLIKTNITPNQVTLVRLFISMPLFIYIFSRGEYIYNLLGVLTAGFLSIFDCVDGDLARKTNKSSALGAWLDRFSDAIIMCTILMSIFFAALTSSTNYLWPLVIVVFFFGFFLLANLLHEFERSFRVNIGEYSKIKIGMYKLSKKFSFVDRVYINFLDVHNSSLAAYSFCISYPLLIGIIFNQLLLAFIFIAIMFNLRFLVLLQIYYKVLKKEDNRSLFIKVLKEYFKDNK